MNIKSSYDEAILSYISRKKMNKHIYNYIKHYINLKISPEYALLISGKWGTGKTFFMNGYLEKESHKECKFIRISLFGIESVNEIHKQIIFQLIGTKEGSWLNSLIKIGSSVIDSFGKKINLGINDIPIEQVLKTLTKKLDKEIVFIFDDLERVTVNVPEILGYINTLVERLKLKTILLANEIELNKKDDYKKFKEKIIGKTFVLKQDFDASFDAFMELIVFSKTVIVDNKTTIEDVFIKADFHNLRHVRQSLLDFEHFFESIDKKFHTKKELMQDLIEMFFIFSIEIKNGIFDIQDLKYLQLVESDEYYMNRIEAEDEKKEFTRKPLDLLFDKYSIGRKESILLTEKMWIELFDFGVLKESKINENFENSKYFVDESHEQEEWISLWHYSNLEDDRFKEKLEVVADNFNNNEYKKPEVLMHVVGLLLNLSKSKLYGKSSIEITNKAKENIDKNLEVLGENIDLEGSSFGLMYFEENTDEFIEVKSYLLDKAYEGINNKLENYGKELIEFLNNNNFVSFRNMLSYNSFEIKLYELPVFSKIDVNSFFNAILNIKHVAFRRILPVIEERYSKVQFNESLIDELEFWQEFEILLDKELPKREKTIKALWLNTLKNRVINTNIIDKLQKAKGDKDLNQTDDAVG